MKADVSRVHDRHLGLRCRRPHGMVVRNFGIWAKSLVFITLHVGSR